MPYHAVSQPLPSSHPIPLPYRLLANRSTSPSFPFMYASPPCSSTPPPSSSLISKLSVPTSARGDWHSDVIMFASAELSAMALATHEASAGRPVQATAICPRNLTPPFLQSPPPPPPPLLSRFHPGHQHPSPPSFLPHPLSTTALQLHHLPLPPPQLATGSIACGRACVSLPGEGPGAAMELTAVLNPLSKEAQRLAPLMMALQQALGLTISLHLNPELRISEFPLENFYRRARSP